jgi:hypothetical protein
MRNWGSIFSRGKKICLFSSASRMPQMHGASHVPSLRHISSYHVLQLSTGTTLTKVLEESGDINFFVADS